MKKKLLIYFTLFLSTFSFSQIELVSDINEGNRDSFATNFITYNNEVYFTATKSFVNYFFKYSNGNVEIVKDQNGFEVRSSVKPIEFNGMLYLNARINNVSGAYSFDGTNFTLLTQDYFYLPQILNNKIFFYNQFNSFNYTLWSTDGTKENTKQFLDVQVFSFIGTGYENKVVDNKLFFVAKNATSGRELWVTDGTITGTKIVKDINQGNLDSNPKDFFASSNDKLYFTAETENNGRELYVTDGTENGTFMLNNFYSGSSGGDFYIEELNNTIFIAKKGGTVDVLFISDGTVNGTKALDSSVKCKKIIKAHNNLIYFEGSITGQNENLIITDGNLSGTKVLKDNLDFDSGEMFLFKDYLYFRGDDGDNVELWKTNGVENETIKVIDIDNNTALEGSFPTNFTIFNDELFFAATQFGVTGTELWKTDGTESGTQLIQDLNTGAGSTLFFEFYPTENELLINLEKDSQIGRELYKYIGNNTASTDSFLNNKNIQVYYSDELFVNGLKAKKAKLSIYNILGKEVLKNIQISSKNNSVDINLTKGVYIVNIILKNTARVSKKILIH